MNVKIGEKIKALRKREDITQEQLAEVLGVTGQAVSKWESGNFQPSLCSLIRLLRNPKMLEIAAHSESNNS